MAATTNGRGGFQSPMHEDMLTEINHAGEAVRAFRAQPSLLSTSSLIMDTRGDHAPDGTEPQNCNADHPGAPCSDCSKNFMSASGAPIATALPTILDNGIT